MVSSGKLLRLSQATYADIYKQNLEAWQAAQAAIREVEPHPSHPPAPEQPELPPKIEINSPVMNMGGLQAEVDRLEAANKPLPLPEGEGIKEPDSAEPVANPSGPL